ncbi:MAG: hypothetical protein ACR2J8_04990, partial [Thermomicrobiales bacterium]
VEHLIVEWSPLPAWARLAEVMPPLGSGRVTRRIIEAEGPEVEAINAGYGRTFHEWVAKNVGIRRAAAETVLITHQDIMLLPELARSVKGWLESGLAGRTFGRCDRLDVRMTPDEAMPEEMTIEEAIGRRHRIHARGGSVDCAGEGIATLIRGASRGRPGDVEQARVILTAYRAGEHDTSLLHTNAAGDFLLARRDDLAAAGGYAEAFQFRSHMDSFIVYRLWGMGIGQAIFRFPAVAVHVNHAVESPISPWEEAAPFVDGLLAGEGYPGQPAEWGLDGVVFEETIVERGGGTRLVSRSEVEGRLLRADGRADLEALAMAKDVRLVLERLRVYRADSAKVRIGRDGDGGYILPERVLEV